MKSDNSGNGGAMPTALHPAIASCPTLRQLTSQQKPTPLLRPYQKSRPIPTAALGALEKVVAAIEIKTQAPAALVMQSVLATVSLAVQAHADVETLGGSAPLSLFFLSVAESGERKSSADKLAIAPIADWEQRQSRAYETKLREYEHRFEVYEAKRRSMVRSEANGGDVIEGEDEAFLSPPLKPLAQRMIHSDVTYEGILRHYEDGCPSIGLYSDEGGQVIGGHAMSADNRLKTAAGLSKLWDAAPIKRTRAGSSIETFSGRRTSLHLMIQPLVAEGVLSDQTMRDQGLLSRTLIAWPEINIGGRFISQGRQKSEGMRLAGQDLEQFYARITHLVNLEPKSFEEDQRELKPHLLTLDEEARSELIIFANVVEEQQATGGEFENIRGFASKAAEQVARIAGALAVFQDENTRNVGLPFVSGAIELVGWYLNEAKRLLDTGYVPEKIRQAEVLRCWLINEWTDAHVDKRSIVRSGPGSIRETSIVSSLVQILEENGWLERVTSGAQVDGKSVKLAWRVVRA